MKKSALIIAFIGLAGVVCAQPSINAGSKSTAHNVRTIVTFGGYQADPIAGLTTEWLSVMGSRIDDVYLSMKKPVYAKSYKPDPNLPATRFVPETTILLGVAYTINGNKYPNTYTVPSLSKNYLGFMMGEENSPVEVVGLGINKDNVKQYRFRVIENDSKEVLSWTIPTLQQKYGAKHAYGYFGKFLPGKETTIEVVNINNYGIRDGVVLNWRNHLKSPEISSIIGIKKEKSANGLTVREKFSRQPITLNADTLSRLGIYFKQHQNMPYDVYWLMSPSEYRSESDTILINSGLRENLIYLYNQYFETAGKYKLLIYPAGTKDKSLETSVQFHVDNTSAYKKSSTFLNLIPYIIVGLLAFGVYYAYAKRRTLVLQRQKETANIKLGSVRAQLNPHFMFNALTSIQNLMHQQDTAGANHYLSKFADLTRHVLNATTTELISLEDELKIIDDYLQIEQLRFGFAYTIDVDGAINKSNTEVPGMLMQPFIENAAKHGINGKANKGKISIAIAKQQNNLLLTVTDNGIGFDTQANALNGFGLKLSRERIALLNQIYKNQHVKLHIHSDTDGTTITITLNAWL